MCSIRKLIKTSALALCFFGFIPSSKALDSYCEALPDCGSLGYEENIECPQGTYITCPYNVSFKKCVNASCEELGYTLTNKTGWCKNIVYCPTDSLYTLCAVECSACPSGELNPTCDYGTSPSSIDDCGHQCYVCKNCNLDEVSGWQTASTECNFSQYVQQEIMPVCPQNAGGAKKYVCGSCPTGMVAPSKNSSSCMCNEVAGYYATCPAGASCKSISTAFGNCYKPEKGAAGEGGDQDADGCDESQGWVLGSSTDTHFIYDETSTFNIDGVALTCKRAVGCNAASDASTNKPSEISAYFATSNKTIGSVKCYWVTGCSETHASSCSEARTLTNAQTKGNFTCGDCVCNETSGYYLTEQEGYSFTMVDGCYKVEGNCVNPYTIDTSDNHFTYGVASVCTKVTGCRLATQGASATNNYDSSYFDVKEVTNGGQKCYYVEGCKSPKVEASSCPEGQKPVNAKTAYNGGITCGTCECDETKGYYQTCPAGAACENVGACVKTVRGNNGDSDGDGCKEADGYVSSTITDNHFNFGSIVSFKVGSSTITCKPVTGCNSAIAASTDQLSGIGAYFATTNKTLGTKTCHWVTGCQSPYADDCSESRTLNGSQTKGGYTCGTCICDTDNGYYDQCPSGQTCKTVDGCETATGCANNYTTNTTDSHFTYGPVLEGTTCREVTGCNSSKDGSTKTKSDINEAYFVINNNGQGKTVGNTTCYWVTGCKSPYKSDCSESRTLDGADTQTRGGYTCGTCICDTNNGWTSNPTGLGGSSIDGCYNTTTCADNYTTNTSDNHFTYGPVVEGTSCREVTGCDNTKAGSTTTKSDINATYFTINNNGQGKTVGMTACYWIIGCQPDYGDTCPTGQKLSGVPSAQGGFTCQSCECDEANGYYKNVPTGQTYEIVNGCYHLTGGCSNPYTSNTSDNHFTYGPADTCTEVTGCNSSQDGSTTQNTYNSTYFDVRSVPNGGWVCYYTNSCKSPYVSTCSATGQKLSNTQTAYSGGPTCGTCTCDTSAGYYSLGFCPESLVCTAVGECEDAEASCNASNGYYDSNTDEHFSFGDAVSKTVELGINKTCYKVTGCNTTKDYISGACPEGTYPYNEDKKGGFTCYKCGSCVPPAGSAASGECPTGYKSSTTVTGNCGGITYYACECDSNNGYYTQSQKEATTGVTFNTHANTGYPTCYTFASCAAGWSAGSAIDDGLVGNIFVSSSLTSITKTDKSSEACYQISGCESPYVNRVCTSSEEQFGQPYVAPNNSSVTCRECRTIPLCPIPQVCNYVTTSVSNGSVVYNFNTTSFNADISAYNTCMGDFTKTAGCSDIGASASASGSITAPNGEKCNPNESSCGASCNSSLASDATTTKPTPVAGYNFDSVSTSDGICYYNISPKTCAEQTSNAYPYETQQTCSSKQTSKSSPSMYYVGASQIYCWSDCQCNETLGYYASNPNTTGMIWSQDSSSGCYRATGCDWQNNWNSSASFYQDYDNTATYLDNGTKKTCYHFTGCKYPYRLQDMRPDYFEIDEIGAAAGETCYYEYECNVGYDIPSGANLANYDYATSAFGLKCGKLACDNVAGAYNEQPSGSTGSLSNNCFYPVGCADGWVSDNPAYFEYGSVSTFTINHGESDITCKQVTGCAEDYNASDINTTYFTYTPQSKGSATCYAETGCNTSNGYSDVSSVSNLSNYDYATSAQTGRKCGKLTCSVSNGQFTSEYDCQIDYSANPDEVACKEVDGCFVFDHYLCDWYTKSDCEEGAIVHHVCEENSRGCFEPTSCDVDNGYYDTENACTSANTGFACAEDDASGCYVKSSCATGYHSPTRIKIGTVPTSCVENTCESHGWNANTFGYTDGDCDNINPCDTCVSKTVATPTGNILCQKITYEFSCSTAKCTGFLLKENRTQECTFVDTCPETSSSSSGGLVLAPECYDDMVKYKQDGKTYGTLNVVNSEGASCGTCYAEVVSFTPPTTTCNETTEFSSLTTCNTSMASVLKSGESCTKLLGSSCYTAYCTASKYTELSTIAPRLKKTILSCSGTQCRTHACQTGRYGAWNDGCITYDQGTTCAAALQDHADALDLWNSYCSNDISYSFEQGSAEANCECRKSGSGVEMCERQQL